VVEKINIFREYLVVRHETGEEEKITLTQLRKKEREKLRRNLQVTKRGGSNS
jgi:signal-transduction protein with cAMP-binding, CBS, and nucleotidyltransferase domain